MNTRFRSHGAFAFASWLVVAPATGCSTPAVDDSGGEDQGELGAGGSTGGIELGNYVAGDSSARVTKGWWGRYVISARIGQRAPDGTRRVSNEVVLETTLSPSSAEPTPMTDQDGRCNLEVTLIDDKSFAARGPCPGIADSPSMNLTFRRVDYSKVLGFYLARDSTGERVWALNVTAADDDALTFTIDEQGRPYWSSVTGKGRWATTGEAYAWESAQCRLNIVPPTSFGTMYLLPMTNGCGLEPGGVTFTRD